VTARIAPRETIRIGDIRLTFLPDGIGTVAPGPLFPGVDQAGWVRHRRWLGDDGRVVTSMGGFLIETGDRKVLVDTGLGATEVEIGASWARGGRFLSSLAATGVRPEEIDIVVYTHLHSDHSGWTGSPDGQLHFPNARHLIGSEAEWAYWQTHTGGWAPPADTVLTPLAGRVEAVGDGHQPAPGVTLLATPGHTPGHQSVMVASGSERAVLVGDILICPIQVSEPELEVMFDLDPALAERTRENALREAEADGTVVACAHFPESAFGRVLRGRSTRTWSTPA
jgi:glyoxylase-like metal-dependent hydrolase (beta-lactamase superfamily II)